MPTSLELFLIDNRRSSDVVALGRRGSDTAIEHLPIDAALGQLGDVGKRIGKAVTGNGNHPSASEIKAFGAQLFAFLFRGDLRDLYDRLPQGSVTVQILSDRAEVKEVPWEYLLTPDKPPAPNRERSVVRVQPTRGIYHSPRSLKKVRVLFVSADPVDQQGVSWSDIESVVSRVFAGHMPANTTIKVVEGATRQALMATIARESFDVFHFFGHGELQGNVGHLVLQDIATGKGDLFSAPDLAVALTGKGVQLAILSACLTGAGNQRDDFAVLATALIGAGIPAVVANQYPIPIKSVAPFVGSLYASLMADGNIDVAVAEGRAMLAAGIPGESTGNVEWGIPTLHRLADGQQIFQVP